MSRWGTDGVTIELYIRGRGPMHNIKLPWEGYERNQVDLEGLMRKYRLSVLYAYSLTHGRGLRQHYNPRTGLSFISYSGKQGSIIRYDADPKPTISSLVSQYAVAAALVVLLVVGTTTSRARWVMGMQQALGGRAAWITCFVVMMLSHLARRFITKRTSKHKISMSSTQTTR